MAHPAYKYDLGLAPTQPNPLPRLSEARLQEMAEELARESVEPAAYHLANLRTIIGKGGR